MNAVHNPAQPALPDSAPVTLLVQRVLASCPRPSGPALSSPSGNMPDLMKDLREARLQLEARLECERLRGSSAHRRFAQLERERDDAQAAAKKLERELQWVQAQAVSLAERAQNAEERVVHLEKEKAVIAAAVQSRLADALTAQQRLRVLESEKAAALARCDELQAKLDRAADAQRKVEEAKVYEQRCTRMENDIAAQAQRLSNALARCAELERESSHMRSAVLEASEQQATAQLVELRSQKEIAQLKARCEALSHESERCARLERERADLSSLRQKHVRIMRDMYGERRKAEQRTATAEREREQALADLERVTREKRALQARIAALASSEQSETDIENPVQTKVASSPLRQELLPTPSSSIASMSSSASDASDSDASFSSLSLPGSPRTSAGIADSPKPLMERPASQLPPRKRQRVVQLTAVEL